MSRSTSSKSHQKPVTVNDVTDELSDDEMKTGSQSTSRSMPPSRGRKSPRPDEIETNEQPNKQSRTSAQPSTFVIGSRRPHHSHAHTNKNETNHNHANLNPRIIDRRRGADGSVRYLHREPLSPVDFDDAADLYSWVDDDVESSDMVYDYHKAHRNTHGMLDSNVLIESADDDDEWVPSHLSSIRIEEIRHEDADGSFSESITIERIEPLVNEPLEHGYHNEPIITLMEMMEEHLA